MTVCRSIAKRIRYYHSLQTDYQSSYRLVRTEGGFHAAVSIQARLRSHSLFSLAGCVGGVLVSARLFHRRHFTRERRLRSSSAPVPAGWVTCALKPWQRSSLNTFQEIRPSFFNICPGDSGRKAANHLYNTARADGLTLFRISSSIVPYAFLAEPGVQYDVDKLIYLGTTEHMLY